jgi:hypothetical protein
MITQSYKSNAFSPRFFTRGCLLFWKIWWCMSGHFRGLTKTDMRWWRTRRGMGDGEGHVSMRIEEGTRCIILGNQPSQGRTLVSASCHAISQSALNHPKTKQKRKNKCQKWQLLSSAVSNTSPPLHPHPPTLKYTTKSNLSLPLSPLFCHVPTLKAVPPSKQIWSWQGYFAHQDLMHYLISK